MWPATTAGHLVPLGELEHAADDLPGKRRRVEQALTRQHEVGLPDRPLEAGSLRDQLEPGAEAGAEGGEAAREAAGGAGAGEGGDVDAELFAVAVGESREAHGELLHLDGPGALLRPEHARGVEERRADVAGHLDLRRGTAPTRAPRPRRGRRRWSRSPPTATRMRSAPAASAAAISSPVPRVVAASGSLRSPRPRAQPGRARHLDHRVAALRAATPPRPASTSGPVTARGAVRAAEHLERPLAAVRERQLPALPAGAPRPLRERPRHLGRRQRAAELVRRSQTTFTGRTSPSPRQPRVGCPSVGRGRARPGPAPLGLVRRVVPRAGDREAACRSSATGCGRSRRSGSSSGPSTCRPGRSRRCRRPVRPMESL